ncbi:MAG: response regulator [Actinobacteria bacterium]|nr:response regulator [Actinomycetota bacterium]
MLLRHETILCVDDDPGVRKAIRRMLVDAGHTCETAGDVCEARRLLARDRYSIVLCDIGLPGESGLDLLAELGHEPGIATVMVTGSTEPGTAGLALELGATGYVTKPFGPDELLINVDTAARRRRKDEAVNEELRLAYAETVKRLGRAMEYHDGETGAHLERVGDAAAAIARELGLPAVVSERIALASPLHDIGKIAISERLLRKRGPLSRCERLEMERHTEVGHDLLTGSGNELLELAATIAWTHHERWDGTGYPRRLAGEDIPVAGRIVAVADVYDALTSDRPYRRAWLREDAFDFIRTEAEAAFDPAVVDAFEHLLFRTRRSAA